jgi:hypothetical protein
MVSEQMTEHEQALIREYENDIKVSFWIMVDRMVSIEEGKLYRGDHNSFGGWLHHRFPELTGRSTGISSSTWRQWKASWTAYNQAKSQGVELSNEYAARELRKAESGLRDLAVHRTIAYHEMKHGEKPEQLTAAMIKPVVKVINDVIAEAVQTGHVDVGDGVSTAFNAAIDVELQERLLRRQQHLIDGAKAKDKKNGWSSPITLANFSDWQTLEIPAPEPGKPIELKWRIIDG